MTRSQGRNVSEETSRTLPAKAASEGRSLSDNLPRELDRIASRPSRAELLERIAWRGITALPPAEEALAQERPSR